jgi:poly-gamma-glutamate capsule biosynthesis protein CapA/YwtB (metallophosphatase superfamily)
VTRILLLACLLSAAAGAVGENSQARILFGGDTSHGDNYQAEIAAQGGTNLLEARGYDYSFQHLAPLLRQADAVVLNLETPLAPQGEAVLASRKLVHWSEPRPAALSLARHGVTAVSLANNHGMDHGGLGLASTLDALSAAGVSAFGAGYSESAAAKPWRTTLTVGNQRVSVSVIGGFSRDSLHDRFGFYASHDSAGVLGLDPESVDRVIGRARQAYPDDFLVIFPHWGSNYTWENDDQRDLARRMIDAGADLVIGHGAHMMQGVERYRKRWIVYGLGNFVFNSTGRFGKFDAPPYSFLASLVFRQRADGGLVHHLELRPVYSDNRHTGFQPRLLEMAEFTELMRLLEARIRRDEDARRVSLGVDPFGNYLRLD